MRSNEKPVMIWTEDGVWYQQRTAGVLRSSYLGHIGTPDEVREWCENHALDFTQKFHAFDGTAIAEKWPHDSARTSSTKHAGPPAVPVCEPSGRIAP